MDATGRRPTLGLLLIFVAIVALGLALAPTEAPALALGPPVAAVAAWSARKFALGVALFVLGFAALGEVVLCFPMPLWMYTSIGLGAAGFFWPGRPENRHASRIVPCGALLALLGVLYLVPWSSRKPFLRALDSIRPGMTLDEVNRRMAGYKEGTGWTTPGSPPGGFRPAGSLVFRHSEDPAFNADWGIVTFAGGRVTAVEFSPD